VLVPAIASTAWDAGISLRVVLFRDWAVKGKDVRLAVVVKAEGRAVGQVGLGDAGRVVPFRVEENGLKEDFLPDRKELSSTSIIVSPQRSRKRKVDEIQVSEEEEDEDYGWADDDEEDLPPPPPQWHGSEDILVPPLGEEDRSEDEEEEEEGKQKEEDEEENQILPSERRGGIGREPKSDTSFDSFGYPRGFIDDYVADQDAAHYNDGAEFI